MGNVVVGLLDARRLWKRKFDKPVKPLVGSGNLSAVWTTRSEVAGVSKTTAHLT